MSVMRGNYLSCLDRGENGAESGIDAA